MALYDYKGRVIDEFATPENIKSNMSLVYGYDESENTRYSIIRVFKQKADGKYQYPFVRYKPTTATSLTLSKVEGWDIIINAALDMGLMIENGVVISDALPTYSGHKGVLPLTIDSNGNLSFTEADTVGKGSELVQQGIVSALCGFFPIINNYARYNYPTDIPATKDSSWTHAQRQIIGQYSNGDYCIITGDGRGYSNSTGLSMAKAQDICMQLGLKFAYNLDGGGSTQTMYRKKLVTPIYEGEYGRYGRGFIVFNGTDSFSVPSA